MTYIIIKMHTTKFADTSSFIQIFCRNANSTSLASVECFHTSAGMPSAPCALPFFMEFTASSNASSRVSWACLLISAIRQCFKFRSHLFDFSRCKFVLQNFFQLFAKQFRWTRQCARVRVVVFSLASLLMPKPRVPRGAWLAAAFTLLAVTSDPASPSGFPLLVCSAVSFSLLLSSSSDLSLRVELTVSFPFCSLAFVSFRYEYWCHFCSLALLLVRLSEFEGNYTPLQL